MKNFHTFLVPAILAVSLASSVFAQPAEKAEKGTLTIISANGKEQQLKGWKFIEGVRNLTWLAKPAPKEEKKPEAKPGEKPAPRTLRDRGPLALVFREASSTLFREGVLTLIPLSSLRSLDYDYENKKVTARVATSDKKEEDMVLTGSAAEYVGINTISIQAEVDKGELGVAEVKYRGGVKGGIKGLRFESPAPLKAPEGRTASVTILNQGEKVTTKVHDVHALYRVGLASQEKLSRLLFFRKTIRIGLDKLQMIKSADKTGKEWSMTLMNGDEETFTLLQPAKLDGQSAFLQGLLGRTKAGYKLYPLHTVAEVTFTEKSECGEE